MFSKRNGILNQIIISSCIYLGQSLLGFAGNWTGPTLPKLRDLDTSPLPYLLSETQLSLVASIAYVGCIPAPYIIGWLSNNKGRKPCLIIGGIVGIISFAILATANNLAMLYCGRILSGFGLGIVSVMNVIYVGEIASTSIRGILLTIIGIFHTCGALLLYSVGPFFSYHVSAYVGLSLATVFTLGTLLLPESPIYYILKDDDEELEKVLKLLGRIDDKTTLYEAKKEYKSGNFKMDWIELFTLKTNRRALFIVLTINLLQQCSGVMAIIFFSASIFEMAGSSIGFDIGMIIVGGFQLLGSVVSPFIVERVGRRILLIVSTAICCISMFSFGLYFYLDHIEVSGIDNVKWLPLVILVIFFIGYDSGIGIIPNVLTGEMFTTNTRSNGSTLAISAAWTGGFVVTTLFSTMVEGIGSYGAFWFFSCVCACAFLFSIFFIPETKSKSLLDIQRLLNQK